MSFLPDSFLVTSVLPEPNYTDGVYSKFYICLHDIECPPGPEWAESLGGPNYLQNPAEQHSVHYIVDSDSVVQGRKESDWAWGCGSPGSKHGIHIEQAGYASFSRAQWLGSASAVGTTYVRPNGAVVTYTQQDADDMAAQLHLVARLFADIITRHGMRFEWANAQEAQAMVNGDSSINKQLSHARVTNWIGGTGHTDPGDGYPYDVLMSLAKAYGNGTSVEPPAPVIVVGDTSHSTPTPTPTPVQEDELSAKDIQDIKDSLAALPAAVAKAVQANSQKPVIFLSVGGGVGEFNGDHFNPKWHGFSKATYQARCKELDLQGIKILMWPTRFTSAKDVELAGFGKQVSA